MERNRIQQRTAYGKVIVILGPSGTGKTFFSQKLIDLEYGIPSITVTTRQPRSNERTSTQYLFVKRSRFKEMIAHNELLVWTIFLGNYYGLQREFIKSMLTSSKDLILDTILPIQELRVKLPKSTIYIYLCPTRMDVLRQRMIQRGMTETEIEQRMIKAQEQLQELRYYDYLVFTDEQVDLIVANLKAIIDTHFGKHPSSLEALEQFRVENAVNRSDLLSSFSL